MIIQILKKFFIIQNSSVHMWSTENAGMLDFTSEVELWTRAGNIKIQLKRDINIRTFERLLAEYIL